MLPFHSKKPFVFNRKLRRKLSKLTRALQNYPLFNLRENAKYTPADIINKVITAAIEKQSLESIHNTSGGISADDALHHLKYKTLIPDIERMLFELLDTKFIKFLRRKFPQIEKLIAIDFTAEMFFGDKECEYVTGYKPQDGSYYCFKFFTVSLLMPEGKYLLFSYPSYRDSDKVWLLNRAFCFLRKLGITPKLCLMDREFYAVDVLAFCRGEQTKYLIPARQDSKFERTVKQFEGLPALFRDYEITNANHESEWTGLVVMEAEDTEEKKIFGFITNIHENDYKEDVYILVDIYKKRWRIETAHRVHDNFRIKTCCKEGNVRYFFFIIAVILYNLWIYLNLLMHDSSSEVYKIKITVYEMKKLIEEFLEQQWRIPIGIAM